MKHENYEILNLLGYGLAKFDNEFIKQFGFTTKIAFFEYFVDLKIVETGSVIKNRMDLFDPFFENNRKGWWQKGDAYIHRKQLIDSLFGNENVVGYANIVKLYLQESYEVQDLLVEVKPIVKSRFRKMSETGLEAELYFINNFQSIKHFEGGVLEDARLYGDGYDFQVSVNEKTLLSEVKGIRAKKGRFRLTENEYAKAEEYQYDYLVTLVLNLDDSPTFVTIENPLRNLKFEKKTFKSDDKIEYHVTSDIGLN